MMKPKLATNFPAPRVVSDVEMVQATSEARKLLVELNKATTGMETLNGNDMRIRLI